MHKLFDDSQDYSTGMNRINNCEKKIETLIHRMHFEYHKNLIYYQHQDLHLLQEAVCNLMLSLFHFPFRGLHYWFHKTMSPAAATFDNWLPNCDCAQNLN